MDRIKEHVMQEKRGNKQAKAAPQAIGEKRTHPWVLTHELRSGNSRPLDHVEHWLAFLAYLAYLFLVYRSMQPTRSEPPYEMSGLGRLIGALRLLIAIVGIVLIVVALVAAAAPEEVVKVISQWPILP
jgi:hypothetical protein